MIIKAFSKMLGFITRGFKGKGQSFRNIIPTISAYNALFSADLCPLGFNNRKC